MTNNATLLSRVERGKKQKPPRILLYGVEKIGKSSFAASAPNCVFVCPEDGISQIDVPHFPEARDWDGILNIVETLINEKHDYKYLVLDTLDWLEPLLWRYIVERDGEKDIESYGYGKGYIAALQEWRLFISRLERLRAKDVGIIMLAHSWVKLYNNPEGDPYDRFEMKLHNKSGGLLKEWCDAVLFANYEIGTVTDKRKRVRGIATGARLIYTQRSAAYDAGNRYNLPPELPLDWDSLSEGIQNNQVATPEILEKRIEELLTEIADAKLSVKVHKAMAGDATTDNYQRIINKLAGMISTKENQA